MQGMRHKVYGWRPGERQGYSLSEMHQPENNQNRSSLVSLTAFINNAAAFPRGVFFDPLVSESANLQVVNPAEALR